MTAFSNTSEVNPFVVNPPFPVWVSTKDHEYDGVVIMVAMKVPDRDHGIPITVKSSMTAQSEWIDTGIKTVLMQAFDHEALESFRFRGELWIDPHSQQFTERVLPPLSLWEIVRDITVSGPIPMEISYTTTRSQGMDYGTTFTVSPRSRHLQQFKLVETIYTYIDGVDTVEMILSLVRRIYCNVLLCTMGLQPFPVVEGKD